MDTKATTTAPLDEARLIGQISFDPDYYRRVVGSESDSPPTLTVIQIGRLSQTPTTFIPESASKPYRRSVLAAWTVATYSETIRKLFSDPDRIDWGLAWKAFNPRYDLQPEHHPTVSTCGTDDSLDDVIEGARRHPRLRYGERLAARLQQLLKISREEQPEQAPPALASVKALIAFLASNPALVYPTTVLTPDGNVRVEWRRGRGEHFAVEFLGDVDVRFVVFAPDPKRPYKTVRVAGGATLESLMTLVAPYGVERWATEEGAVQAAG